MTLKELSQLYYLKKLIDRDAERLEVLKSRAYPGAAKLNDTPKVSSSENVIETVVPLMIEVEDRIRDEQMRYIEEQKKIESYINGIADYQVRIIMACRFVDLMTWNQVANYIGGNNTEDSVKKCCYRYLKNNL